MWFIKTERSKQMKENAMRPLSYEERMESLRLAEDDPVYYTHEEVKKMTTTWIK